MDQKTAQSLVDRIAKACAHMLATGQQGTAFEVPELGETWTISREGREKDQDQEPQPHPWALVIWATTAVVAAFDIAQDLWRSASWLNWPFGQAPSIWWAFADGAVFVAAVVMTWRAWRRRSTGDGRRLLTELAALAAARADGEWLNRDEHVIFKTSRHLRVWVVIRIPEDTIHDAASDGEPAPIMFEKFLCTPGAHQVIRMDDTAMITPDGDGVDVGPLPGQKRGWRHAWRTSRITSGPYGTVYAADAEVAELITQLTNADHIPHPGSIQ